MLARVFLTVLFALRLFPAELTYSTFLKTGFTPAAVATDNKGNVYVAGSSVDSDVALQRAVVVKVNPQGSAFIYVREIAGVANNAALGIAVDANGNAFVAGTTYSSDFPVTRQMGSLPSNDKDARAFLMELDPQGSVVFSEALGMVSNSGLAVGLTAAGEIVVSGVANASGFAATAGAFSVPDSNGRPYVTKLDSTGAKILFTATGIGGSSLAFDASGNIFMAGSTELVDYPTTPGALQAKFEPVFICFELCHASFRAVNQYLTKLDPTGAKLIYSTAVAGGGQTTNTGLAVDAAGNAYVSGLADEGFPYTVKPPIAPQEQPFLVKIDPSGGKILYAVAVGGRGVQVGANGDVYVGGSYNNVNFSTPVNTPLASPPPGLPNLPAPCQSNNATTLSQAYVSRVDGATGDVLGTVLVDGSNLVATSIALTTDGQVFVAGTTNAPDVPITAGALTPAALTSESAGAFLAAANFSKVEFAATPQVACVLDGADLMHAGPVVPNQLLTLFGSGLGSLTDTSVKFDGVAAKILYASDSQVNVAIPLVPLGSTFTTMQIAVRGIGGTAREFALVRAAPNLFIDLSKMGTSCMVGSETFATSGYMPVVRNADSTINSCEHPAKAGDVVSFFLDGTGVNPGPNGITQVLDPFSMLIAVNLGEWSAEVTNVTMDSDFVTRVDVRVPKLSGYAARFGAQVRIRVGDDYVGPFNIGAPQRVIQNLFFWVEQ